MPNWDSIRSHFPALQNFIYLNTAGGCALPTCAADAGRQYFDEMEMRGDVCWPQWLERTEAVRKQFADYIKCSPEEIAFVSNASFAMNLAEKYAPTGDVLLVEEDFPSVTLPWLAAKRKPVFVQPGNNGQVAINSLADKLSPDVSSIAVGHVHYSTGYAFDLEELSSFCANHSLFLALDVTQSFGAIPIDVNATPVDSLLLSGYKWSIAGYGIGVLYLKQEHHTNKPLPVAGWRSAKVPYKMLYDELDPSPSVAALELGHPPFPGIFALGGALRLLEEVGQSEIFNRIVYLSDYLHGKVSSLNGVRICSTSDRNHRSGITMLSVGNPEATADALKEKGVFVSVRNGLLRVSVHFYNLESDVDVFVEELDKLL